MLAVSRLKFLVPTLLLAGLAACSDDGTAPSSAAMPAVPGLPNAAIYVKSIDTTSAVKSANIVVTPEGGFFMLGTHGVYFPPNAICDPARSTYGPTEWDKPCSTITKPIAIHAEIDSVEGAWIVFKPDLRFKASSRSDRWVYLFMYSTDAAGRFVSDAEADAKYKIDWLPGGGLPAVDEAVTDRTLKTRAYGETGFMYRRVKHFSGYMVSLGRTATVEIGADLSAGVELF